jgi:hypothetical protein
MEHQRKCSKCMVEHPEFSELKDILVDEESRWVVRKFQCNKADCQKSFVYIALGRRGYNSGMKALTPELVEREFYFSTKGDQRSMDYNHVPDTYVSDYREACFNVSNNARESIQLSTKCLRNLLSERGGYKAREFFDIVQMAIESNHLPQELKDCLISLKNIENIAIVNSRISTAERGLLEKAEAEWKLDLIESLFHFYFKEHLN